MNDEWRDAVICFLRPTRGKLDKSINSIIFPFWLLVDKFRSQKRRREGSKFRVQKIYDEKEWIY